MHVIWIHPHDFPDVAVEIIEAAAIHEAVIGGFLCLGRPRFQGGIDHDINTGFAVQAKAVCKEVVAWGS